MNQWKKQNKWFIKETDTEFKVVSCIGYRGIEKDNCIYGPSLHTIDKLNYPESSINEIAKEIFPETYNEMSLAEKIVYISAFMGTCTDLKDEDNERLWITFENEREASDEELQDKLWSIIEEYNL